MAWNTGRGTVLAGSAFLQYTAGAYCSPSHVLGSGVGGGGEGDGNQLVHPIVKTNHSDPGGKCVCFLEKQLNK